MPYGHRATAFLHLDGDTHCAALQADGCVPFRRGEM